MTNTDQIEDFRLPASTGATLSLESFRGKVSLALVFLPEDEQAALGLLEEMDRRHKEFGDQRAQLLAVMKATARQVREMADEHGLSVPILADASGAMARDYDASHLTAAAVVADKEGNVHRRFTEFLDGNDAGPAVESILYTVRALGTQALDADEREQ